MRKWHHNRSGKPISLDEMMESEDGDIFDIADPRSDFEKACLVTSSYFTRDAVAFAENQNFMIDLIDGDALHDMIVRSAEKYEQENYRRW